MIAFFFAESIDQEKHFLINQLSGSLFQIIYINVNNFYIFSHYLKEKSCSMNCLNKVPYIGINAVLRKKKYSKFISAFSHAEDESLVNADKSKTNSPVMFTYRL